MHTVQHFKILTCHTLQIGLFYLSSVSRGKQMSQHRFSILKGELEWKFSINSHMLANSNLMNYNAAWQHC